MSALPEPRAATAPPPRRDQVRLLVARPDGIAHTRFDRLAEHLRSGDLVVVNTSATLPAAVDGRRGDLPVTLHFAVELDDHDWVAELRPGRDATGPLPDVTPGDRVDLPDGVVVTVLAAHPPQQRRLWRVRVAVEGGVEGYLRRVGRPIRYGYVPRSYPIEQYQTVFARRPGSAEMPSAGRPFTDALITELVTRGVVIAPITLHAGVSSQDVGEPPQPERFAVPEETARLVNMTRAWGNRVVAVGTTVTRALETAADRDGVVREASGWTDVVLGPKRPARVVSGLITGWHDTGASHIELLRAVAGDALVEQAYAEALRERYLWHEFGDSCLLLP
jgi:S-adenosylmethionine:tRNA ribosyltransferase-isomerase